MDYKNQIEKIRQILDEAQVPKYWYNINTPVDNKISIVAKPNGINLFIVERGNCFLDKIFTDWYEAIQFIAEMVELQYTERIMHVAQKYRSVL